MPSLTRCLYLIAALSTLYGTSCVAQARAPQAKPAARPVATKPALPPIPDDFRLNMLIRSTVIALNQANVTGNYTVLRDLGAPGFQSANNPAKLSQIFAGLRAKNLDLTPVFFINPVLQTRPMVDERGLLRVKGFFPSQPNQIVFEMMFQQVAGRWLVFGIAVDTALAPMQAQDRGAPPVPPAVSSAAPQMPGTTPPPIRPASTGGTGPAPAQAAVNAATPPSSNTAPAGAANKAESTTQTPRKDASAAAKLPQSWLTMSQPAASNTGGAQ